VKIKKGSEEVEQKGDYRVIERSSSRRVKKQKNIAEVP